MLGGSVCWAVVCAGQYCVLGGSVCWAVVCAKR